MEEGKERLMMSRPNIMQQRQRQRQTPRQERDTMIMFTLTSTRTSPTSMEPDAAAGPPGTSAVTNSLLLFCKEGIGSI